MKIPTLHHVPKGVRDAWARLVCEVLCAVSKDPSNTDAWHKFFMLPRCILANPVRGGWSHWRDTEKTIRNRIRKWRVGDILGLWSEVEVGETQPSLWEAQEGVIRVFVCGQCQVLPPSNIGRLCILWHPGHHVHNGLTANWDSDPQLGWVTLEASDRTSHEMHI